MRISIAKTTTTNDNNGGQTQETRVQYEMSIFDSLSRFTHLTNDRVLALSSHTHVCHPSTNAR